MVDLHHENDELLVLHLVNDAVITDADTAILVAAAGELDTAWWSGICCLGVDSPSHPLGVTEVYLV